MLLTAATIDLRGLTAEYLRNRIYHIESIDITLMLAITLHRI